MRQADFYKRESNGKIRCLLCPHSCLLVEDESGICLGRVHQEGQLLANSYGQITGIAIDPIEKKPLYHYQPGNKILSIGTYGCNLNCRWCQNSHISQSQPASEYLNPEKLAERSLSSGSIGVAFTYNEPVIWYEYIMDAAPLIHEQGGSVVLVSNGFIEEGPLLQLIPHIDAINVDLKFMSEKLYRKYSSGSAKIIKRNIEILAESDVHLELTHLLVSGLVDNVFHLEELTGWVGAINENIPLHLSRYFPQHNWDESATDSELLDQTKEIAEKNLNFVYLGNISDEKGNSTFCPSCKSEVIRRSGYSTNIMGLNDNRCAKCGGLVPIVHK